MEHLLLLIGQFISKIPSISTATPSGKDAAETAERECFPESPSISTRIFDAPLTTWGCSVNSPIELTNPVNLITLTNRSRSPLQAVLT